MKKIFLLLCLFCVINSVKAQEIVQNGKEWAVVAEDNYTPSDNAYTITYFFQGDTIIESTLYKILYSSLEKDKSDASIVGFLRENNGRVYARESGWKSGSISEEGLLYDFSLQIGDTVIIQNKFYSKFEDPLTLDTIIHDVDEQKLKSYYLTIQSYGTMHADIWYSGIGSHCGIIFPTADLFLGAPRPALLCCKDSTGKLLYQNPKFNTCYYYVGIEDLPKNKQLQISISPNPVTDYIRLEINDLKQEKYTFKLYNSQGNLVLQKEIAAKVTKIPVKELPQGVYFYAVSNKEQSVFEHGKIVKVK